MRKSGRWAAFAGSLDDERICLASNAAERAHKGIASGLRSSFFSGSWHGSGRMAVMASLFPAAGMNDVHPHARMADGLARLPGMPVARVLDLLEPDDRH